MKPFDKEPMEVLPEPIGTGPVSALTTATAPSGMPAKQSVAPGDCDSEASSLTGGRPSREMSLEGHLTELRRALLIVLGTLATATIVCFIFSQPLMRLLLRPAGAATQFIFVAPAESFLATMKVSALGGLFLSLPIALQQIYWFVEPGLTAREKRHALPLLVAAYLLFLTGVVFAYALLLPLGLKFLYGFVTVDNLSALPSIGHYVSFASTFLLVTGLIFELPLLLLFLTVIRLVNAEFLGQHRRYAIVGAFIVAMILSPSADVFTQVLLASALIGLYELSIWLIRFVAPGYGEDQSQAHE